MFRIFHVDDDPAVSKAVKRRIEQALPGVKVTSYLDPVEFWTTLGKMELDDLPGNVVISDQNMDSGFTGESLLTLLRVQYPSVTCIMYATASSEVIQRLQEGGDHFFPKPDLEPLIDFLRSLRPH